MKKFLLLLLFPLALSGQVNNVPVEPLAAPIIGFHASGLVPNAGPMNDLYKPPYLGFGMDVDYKFKNNLLLYIDGTLMMGSNNLRDRTERMPNVFTRDSLIIGTGGSDANVTCYNRGLNFKAGLGYILPFSAKNPNTGLLVRASGGFMTQRTIFMVNDEHAPQVESPYNKLYDHRRSGWVLSESVGYMFMSNHRNVSNFYVVFEISQFWSHSTRPYIIDELMGLHGKDENRYFDMLFSLKGCWMIPLTGKPAREFLF